MGGCGATLWMQLTPPNGKSCYVDFTTIQTPTREGADGAERKGALWPSSPTPGASHQRPPRDSPGMFRAASSVTAPDWVQPSRSSTGEGKSEPGAAKQSMATRRDKPWLSPVGTILTNRRLRERGQGRKSTNGVIPFTWSLNPATRLCGKVLAWGRHDQKWFPGCTKCAGFWPGSYLMGVFTLWKRIKLYIYDLCTFLEVRFYINKKVN